MDTDCHGYERPGLDPNKPAVRPTRSTTGSGKVFDGVACDGPFIRLHLCQSVPEVNDKGGWRHCDWDGINVVQEKVGSDGVADELDRGPRGPVQLALMPTEDEGTVSPIWGRRRGWERVSVGDDQLTRRREAAMLDGVHAAMLLQVAGLADALRAMLKAEQDRGPGFLRLANALSALYPNGSEENRLLDAMLLVAPR